MSKLTTVLKAMSGIDTKMEFTGHLTIKMSDLKIEYSETKTEDYMIEPNVMRAEIQLKDFEISGDVNATLDGFLKLVNSVGDALHKHPSDGEKSHTCNCGKTECDSEPTAGKGDDTRTASNEEIKNRDIIECVNRYFAEDTGANHVYTRGEVEIGEYDLDCLHGETLLRLSKVDSKVYENMKTIYAIRVPSADRTLEQSVLVHGSPYKIGVLASASDGAFYYCICM